MRPIILLIAYCLVFTYAQTTLSIDDLINAIFYEQRSLVERASTVAPKLCVCVPYSQCKNDAIANETELLDIRYLL